MTFRPSSLTAADRMDPIDVAMPNGTSRLGGMAFVDVSELEAANIQPGASAADVEARLSAYRAEQRAIRNEQRAQSRARNATRRSHRPAAPNP